MPEETVPIHVTVLVGVAGGAPPEEVDALARGLLREVRELEVEAAELAAGGEAPAGAKSAEAVTLGAVALAVLPTVPPKVVDFVQAWALRGQGRVVRFKGKVGGQEMEFEGTAAELQTVLKALAAVRADEPAPPSPPSEAA